MNTMKNGILNNRNLKESAFKTPEDYFESVEASVFDKLVTEKFPEKEGFTTPQSYFDTVEQSIFEKTVSKKGKVIRLNSFFVKRFLPVAAAASLLILVLLNYNSKQLTFETLATSDIENWIDQGLVEVDPYQLAEVYSDVDLNPDYQTNDEEIIEYLDGTDIEELIIETQQQ